MPARARSGRILSQGEAEVKAGKRAAKGAGTLKRKIRLPTKPGQAAAADTDEPADGDGEEPQGTAGGRKRGRKAGTKGVCKKCGKEGHMQKTCKGSAVAAAASAVVSDGKELGPAAYYPPNSI